LKKYVRGSFDLSGYIIRPSKTHPNMTEFMYLSQANLRDQQIVRLVVKNDMILVHTVERMRNIKKAVEK
jgi:hypothetical protein